uniref:Rab-GAP TBC domain-containing protein n=1 Tax=Arcella intermedia TaxID=1963864 RepID=A0A6B2L6V7_9EUKA
MKRTFANHRFFKTPEGRDKLFNILKAYSVYNKEVGYCQGMSYVCATLLIQLDEKETFWAFTKLMETFHPFYHPSMAALVEGNNVFWKLLKYHNPTVHAHLEQLQAQVMIFVTKWYLTLFTDLNNWRTVLRLWDIIIYEGKMSVHKIGLALFKCCSEEIMNCTSIETLVPLMLNIPKHKVDTQALLAAVYEIDMTKLLRQMESDVATTTQPVPSSSSKPSLLNYVNQIFSDSQQSGIRRVFSKKPPQHITNNQSPLMERKESRNGFRLSFGFLRNSSGTPKTRTPAQTPPASNSRAGSPQKVLPTVSQSRPKRPSLENSHSAIPEINEKTRTPSVSASSTSSHSTSESISSPTSLTSPTASLKGGNLKGFQSFKLSENNS